MERASKSASRALSNGHSGQPAADSEIPPLVAWLWQQLVAMYGPAVLTAYAVDDKPPKLWVGALSKLTADEAKQGIATLAKQGRSYPPNLTEVLEACRPPRRVRYLGRPTTPGALSLPRPVASEETRSAVIARMRQLFGPSKPKCGRCRDRGCDECGQYVEDEGTRGTRACTCKAQGTCDTCRWFSESA